jgi:ribosomal protein S18 acetylase RimI-like enzyme
MNYEIRNFRTGDAAGVNNVALAAFEQYRSAYSDWVAFSRNIGDVASLAETNEVIVADAGSDVGGAVVYVGPGKPKPSHFNLEWPLIRILSVLPSYRGHGIGRALTEECIRRARRDGALVISLHTAHMMKVALPMYRRMGFEFYGDAPPLFGVPYGIYLKRLNTLQDAHSNP